MSASKPNNSERNARILDLARQCKSFAQIAAELRLSRGVVGGVLRRARDAGMLPKSERPVLSMHRQHGDAQEQGQGQKDEGSSEYPREAHAAPLQPQ